MDGEKNEKKQQVAYRLNHYRDEGLRERNWFQQPFQTEDIFYKSRIM